jgi:hypothetical protein
MARVFTLPEAQELMPLVMRMTTPAFHLAMSLAEELEEASDEGRDDDAEALRERIQAVVESWAEGIRELGAEVKGLWLVDFDSGDGYWCWAHPEEALDHWHSYEGGFNARVPADQRPAHAEAP